jgi:hypothetical protein
MSATDRAGDISARVSAETPDAAAFGVRCEPRGWPGCGDQRTTEGRAKQHADIYRRQIERVPGLQ